VPQRVVGRPVQPGECLPLVEQVAEPVGAVAPVVALAELLGLDHDLLLAFPRLLDLLRALPPAYLALLREHRPERVEPGRECGEVADRVGVGDLVADLLHRLARLVGRERRAVDALFEEVTSNASAS
jgi:hypothetical protein